MGRASCNPFNPKFFRLDIQISTISDRHKRLLENLRFRKSQLNVGRCWLAENFLVAHASRLRKNERDAHSTLGYWWPFEKLHEGGTTNAIKRRGRALLRH